MGEYTALNKSIIKEEKEAVFLVTLTGIILECNTKAALMFGFDSISQVTGKKASDLVPEDFSKHFPTTITEEHLTKGDYLPRVNKRKNGHLFATKILTYFKNINGEEYVMVHVQEAPEGHNIYTLCLEQNIELLKCELEKERNKNKIPQPPSIEQQLKKNFPLLTTKDLRFCSLLLKNHSSLELTQILSISIDGVFAARKRIRKKLGLTRDQDLITFLNKALESH